MVSLSKIEKAASRLEGVIHRTELDYSTTFSYMTGNEVFLKPENLQKTGSFKIRGAYNKIAQLTKKEKEKGVIASSAGNHAQGVALGAAENDLESVIVMPEDAPIAKVTATENYGAEVVLHGSTYEEAYKKAKQLQKEEGYTFLPPFNDQAVIAGQGTIGLEIIADLDKVEFVLVPIGGGGLISGVALAVKELKPEVKVIGVEAKKAASMKESLQRGEITELEDSDTSIADGIAVKKPGELTYKICRDYVDQIVTVSDKEVANAILMLLERSKMTVEGAGAVTLAALLNNKIKVSKKKIAAILSGGNIDVNMIAQIIERGLVKAGRRIKFKTILRDKPGSLEKLLRLIAKKGANVISVNHDHCKTGVPLDRAEVELELEIRNKDHAHNLYRALEQAGYEIVN